MNKLLSLIEYDKWANDRTLMYLRAAEKLDPKAKSLFAHILNAQHIWMHRIKGSEFETLDLDMSLDAALELQQSLYDQYLELLSWMDTDELESIVTYHDSQGNAWTNSISEIVFHVVNHGTYHRGQIALLVRAEGDVPVATDMIAMAREARAGSVA